MLDKTCSTHVIVSHCLINMLILEVLFSGLCEPAIMADVKSKVCRVWPEFHECINFSSKKFH